MSNVIRFEIETDSIYNEAEKEALLDSLVEFISDADGSVIEGTEDLKIIDSNVAGNVQSKDEIIAEAVNEASFRVTVELISSDGNILAKFNDVS